MADIHPSTIENLIACRDQLAFTLTDQFPPPPVVADPLWETQRLLASSVESMKAKTGYVEGGINRFGPKPD